MGRNIDRKMGRKKDRKKNRKIERNMYTIIDIAMVISIYASNHSFIKLNNLHIQ